VHLFVFLSSGFIPDSLPAKFRKLIRANAKMCFVRNGKLFRKYEVQGQMVATPYVPLYERQTMLKSLHETLGHLATNSVLDSLRSRCWWPMMLKDLKEFTKNCSVCELNRAHPQAPPPLHPLPPPGIPFYRWGLDFVQDLPVTVNGNTQIITCMDYATRFVVAKAVPDRSAKTVAQFLYELMMKFGAPHEIITDRAQSFSAAIVKEYLQIQATNHFPSTPYHPQTNGLVERMHGVLGPIITKMSVHAREKWDEFVNSAVFILNARKHSVTGYSPFFLVYGLQPRLPGDVHPPGVFDLRNANDVAAVTSRELRLLGQARAAALVNSQRQARQMSDSRGPPSPTPTYSVNDWVKLRNPKPLKFESDWIGPYMIREIGPHGSYFLMKPDGTFLPLPVNQVNLRPWLSISIIYAKGKNG
jgi:hypothetical protein